MYRYLYIISLYNISSISILITNISIQSIILYIYIYIIELDDGKILTGKPDQFDGKKTWVSC